MSKVVVTGIGLSTCLGASASENWSKVIIGQSGITSFLVKPAIPCKIAGVCRPNPKMRHIFTAHQLRQMPKSSLLACMAGRDALQDAGLLSKCTRKLADSVFSERFGVSVGTGMSDLGEIYEFGKLIQDDRYSRLNPFFIPRILNNMPAGHLSIHFGLKGPILSPSTACTTGLHAVGDGFRLIKEGYADVVLCGGVEASLNDIAISGFSRMRALSTAYNDRPTLASRPFDIHRDGFVIAEGAGILVLENEEHAMMRSADKVYARIIGYGMSGDAHHVSAPTEDGNGPYRSMKSAIENAGIEPCDIGHINCHATSTPLGDAAECRAILKLFGEKPSLTLTSIKGSIGHTLGAAGSVEAIFTVLTCYHKQFPVVANFGSCDPEFVDVLEFVRPQVDVNLNRWESQSKRKALTNSFGFGGTNASLVIEEYP